MKTRNPLFLVYRTSVAGFPIVCQKGKRTIDLSVCVERYAISDLHCEKSFCIPVPSRDVNYQNLPDGNNLYMLSLFSPSDSLVSDISAGDENIEKLFYGVSFLNDFAPTFHPSWIHVNYTVQRKEIILYRVPDFLSSRLNWAPPPQTSVALPLGPKWGGTYLLAEEELRDQVQTTRQKLYTASSHYYVRYAAYCIRCFHGEFCFLPTYVK